MRIAVLSFALLLCGAAGAQTVHPAIFKDKTGLATATIVFHRSRIASVRKCRWQQIQDIKPASALPIHGIAFRMASSYRPGVLPDHGAFQARLSLVLSTASVGASGMSNYFKKNDGGDAVTVISPKIVHFPAHRGYGFPNPFEYRLPFDQGKIFVLGAGKSLCWDLLVFDNDLYSKARNSIPLDEAVLSSNCFNTPFGKGGTVPGGTSPFTAEIRVVRFKGLGFKVYGGCRFGPPSGWGLFLVSLGSGSGGLLSPSAPLWVDPTRILALFGPFPLDSKGGFYQSNLNPYVSTPLRPWFLGFQIFSQWFAFDKAARLYSSNGSFSQFSLWSDVRGRSLGAAHLFLTNDSAIHGTKGVLKSQEGLVTRIF